MNEPRLRTRTKRLLLAAAAALPLAACAVAPPPLAAPGYATADQYGYSEPDHAYGYAPQYGYAYAPDYGYGYAPDLFASPGYAYAPFSVGLGFGFGWGGGWQAGHRWHDHRRWRGFHHRHFADRSTLTRHYRDGAGHVQLHAGFRQHGGSGHVGGFGHGLVGAGGGGHASRGRG